MPTKRPAEAGEAISSPGAAPSAWRPFRHASFAVLWAAMLISNIGGWMHDVGAGWLMTTLSPSPLMVALVQAATTLPVFLLALPSGALADLVDRKRLLIVAKAVMTLTAGTLGFVVLAGGITPAALLAFTFAMGVGTALINPAWQAIVPQLVPRPELASAVALNSVGINLSRAIGPALGGAVIVSFGLAWPFLLNALSFMAVIGALIWWRPPAQPSQALPAERWLGAMGAGLRYVRSSPPLRGVLLRAGAFLVFASAYWALLPLIARERLNGGAELYGALVASIGAGAVIGALLLPSLRSRYGAGTLVLLSTFVTAVSLIVFALVSVPALAFVAAALAGAAWIAAVSSFNVAAQMSLPDWVRARGLAVFGTVFFGSLALGSALWGQAAAQWGIPAALLVAAGGVLATGLLTVRIALPGDRALDLSPAGHWPQPPLAMPVEPDCGPVLVTVEYLIDTSRVTEFLAVLDELALARRRDGAFAWGVFRDAAAPQRFLEYFIEDSWAAHLRHHARVTQADRELQARAQAFHIAAAPPRVEHFIAADTSLAVPGEVPGVTGGLQ